MVTMLLKPNPWELKSSPVWRPVSACIRDQVMRLPDPGKDACHVGVRGVGESLSLIHI